MANVNLSGMTVEALMDLRKRIDETLLERRDELQKQLERMGRGDCLDSRPTRSKRINGVPLGKRDFLGPVNWL